MFSCQWVLVSLWSQSNMWKYLYLRPATNLVYLGPKKSVSSNGLFFTSLSLLISEKGEMLAGPSLIFQFGQMDQSDQPMEPESQLKEFQKAWEVSAKVLKSVASSVNNIDSIYVSPLGLQIVLLEISFSKMRVPSKTFIFLFKWHIRWHCFKNKL